MIYERAELLDLYNGPDNLPGQWLSVGEVADRLAIDAAEVRQLFEFYAIDERTRIVDSIGYVWNLLVDEWCMVYGEDFFYNSMIGRIQIHIHLERDNVGFMFIKLPPNTVEIMHIHGVNIFKIDGEEDRETILDRVRDILRENRVSKRSRKYGKTKSSW